MYSKTDGIKSVFVLILVNEMQCLCYFNNLSFLSMDVGKNTTYICVHFMVFYSHARWKFLIMYYYEYLLWILQYTPFTEGTRAHHHIATWSIMPLESFWYSYASEKLDMLSQDYFAIWLPMQGMIYPVHYILFQQLGIFCDDYHLSYCHIPLSYF